VKSSLITTANKERFCYAITILSLLFMGGIPNLGIEFPEVVNMSLAIVTGTSMSFGAIFLRERVNRKINNLENDNKQLKLKPKKSRKARLICPSKSRLKTKKVMDKQVLKSLESFNNRVDHYKKWLKSEHKHYIKNVDTISSTVNALSPNDLFALRQAVSEYPADTVCMLFSSEIKNILSRNRQMYTLRTAKQQH